MNQAYRFDAPAGHIAAALGADAAGDVWHAGGVAPGGYRVDVIADLMPVVALFWQNLVFGHQGFADVGLGALDPAGGLRFLDHVHLDEQIDVWHDQRKGVELAQRAVGLG